MLIYFAGPLFSAAERDYNRHLTDKLEASGYRVFLPQRDGVDGHRPPYMLTTSHRLFRYDAITLHS